MKKIKLLCMITEAAEVQNMHKNFGRLLGYCDGYQAYKKLGNVVLVQSLAHSRRKIC